MITTNANDLMTAPDGTTMVVRNVPFTLVRQQSGSVCLTAKRDNKWIHICDPLTPVVVFSRRELVDRLLSGNYLIH